MRNVSEEYKDKMAEQFRDQSAVEIDLYTADILREAEAELRSEYVADSIYYSGSPFPAPGKVDSATFEKDFMIVGSSQVIARDKSSLPANIMYLDGITSTTTAGEGQTMSNPVTGMLQFTSSAGAWGGSTAYACTIASPRFVIDEAGTYYFNAFLQNPSFSSDALSISIYDTNRSLVRTVSSINTSVSLGSLQKGYTYELSYVKSLGSFERYPTYYPMVSRVSPTEFIPYDLQNYKGGMARNIYVGEDIGSPATIQMDFLGDTISPNDTLMTLQCVDKQREITVTVTSSVGFTEITKSSVDKVVIKGSDISLSNFSLYRISIELYPLVTRRVRVQDITLGEIMHFDMTNLMSADIEQQSDAIASQLPYTTLNFSATNYEREFDIDNTEGLYAKIKEQQRVFVYHKIGSSVTALGQFFLEAPPSVNGSRADFVARDGLSFMNFSVLPTEAMSYGAAFSKHLARARALGVDITTEDLPMEEYILPGVISDMTFAEMLQALASIRGVTLKSPDEGHIVFGYRQNKLFNDYLSIMSEKYDPNYCIYMRDWKGDAPIADKSPLVRNVSSSYQSLQGYGSTTDTVTITGAVSSGADGNTLIIPDNIRVNTYLEYSVTTSGATVTAIEVYTDRVHVVTSNSGTLTVTITGSLFTSEDVSQVIKYNESGDDLDYGNPFYCIGTSQQTASLQNKPLFLTWIKNHTSMYDKPLKYSGSYMQDIRVQAGDIVYFDTVFKEKCVGIVERVKYNLTSCWGEIELRRLD